MIKKQRFIICVLVLVVVSAMLAALVACDVVIYEPEKGKKPPVSNIEVPMPLEYKLFVQGNSGRLAGTPIGSTVPEYYVFTEGATFLSALNYVKEGYEIAGWYTDAEFNNVLSSYVMPNRDLYVYAKWNEVIPVVPPVVEPNSVTITFNVKTMPDITDSAQVAPITGIEGEKIKSDNLIDFERPSASGFTFLGWFANESLTIPFVLTDDTVFPVGDITLYAKWEKQFFWVRYNTNEGSNVSPVKLVTGSKVLQPKSPIKAGYEFDDWYMMVDIDGISTETKVDFSNLYIEDKDIEIYAKWIAGTYTITFDEKTAGAAYSPISALVDVDVTALIPTPSRIGYDFIGWYENMNITSESKPFDPTKMLPYDATLYAHWAIKDHSLTVSIGSGDIIGSLYPEGDPGQEPVYVVLKAKASAETEHTDFKSLSFVIAVTELNITLSDGSIETLSNAVDIAKLLRFSCKTNTLIKDELTDVRLDFILDKDAPIKYAGASFELKIKFYTSAIVDAGGNDVDADDIKPTVEIE